MYIGLKIHNVTSQIVDIVELIIFEVAKVMNVHVPFGSAHSALQCMLGIKV